MQLYRLLEFLAWDTWLSVLLRLVVGLGPHSLLLLQRLSLAMAWGQALIVEVWAWAWRFRLCLRRPLGR